MLKIDVALSDGPGPVNEDAIGHCGDAAWVIDGATGIGGALLDAPSDAAWLATTASRLLAETLAENPDQATVNVLRTVMERCAEALSRDQVRPADGTHDLPSAAFAMVRVLGDVAEFTTLADCRIIALGDDGHAELFGTSALDAIEARTVDAVKAIRAANEAIDPAALKALLLPGLLANRRLMNRDDGYWVLGTDPAAADHVWQTVIPLRSGQRFAVASDGLLRLVELFATATPADLLAITTPADAARWLDRLRRSEDEPGSLDRHARVKMHDDASLIVCTWAGRR